jgi:hypothetical protein
MSRLRVGDEVRVRFLDHVEDGSEPIEFVVYGRVADMNSSKIVVDSWAYADGARGYDSNVKRYCLLRKVVLGVDVLVERDAECA